MYIFFVFHYVLLIHVLLIYSFYMLRAEHGALTATAAGQPSRQPKRQLLHMLFVNLL